MQLLWTSKSQFFLLEESSLYGNRSDEISCVEHLCDSLCYQLDLASFVVCVNSGQKWSSKLSLLLSGQENMVFGNEDARSDTFVENFVLERLSAQTPLRVLFDVVPWIKFQDAIELFSMQPIATTPEAGKGKLHNLARAISDEETEGSFSKGGSSYMDRKVLPVFEKDGVLGLGLKVSNQLPQFRLLQTIMCCLWAMK